MKFGLQKRCKYEGLKTELEKEGYSVIVKAMEIEARGSVAGTQYQFQGQTKARFIKFTGNSSMRIWNKRNIPWNI